MATRERWAGAVPLTLALAFSTVMFFTVASRNGLLVGALFPVGFCSGLLLRGGPGRLVIGFLGVFAMAWGSQAVPPVIVTDPIQIAVAMGVGVESLLLAGMLLWRSGGARPELRTLADSTWLLVSALVAVALGAATVQLTTLVTGIEIPATGLLILSLSHLASHLVILPFLMTGPDTPRRAPGRRVLVSAGSVAIWTASIVFVTQPALPQFLFLLVPLTTMLALWGSPREVFVLNVGTALVALGAVLLLATDDPLVTSWIPHTPNELLFAMALFACACAISAVPLVLALNDVRLVADTAYEEAEQNLQTLHSATGTALIGTDTEGKINFFNQGAVELLGYRPEEVLGESALQFHLEDDLSRSALRLGVGGGMGALAQEIAISRPAKRQDWRMRRKDGQVRIFSVVFNALRGQDGEVVGYLAACEDVTAQRVERSGLHDGAEDRESGDVPAEKPRAQVLFTVAEQLRAPVGAAAAYADLLENHRYGGLTPAQQGVVREVARHLERVRELVGELSGLVHPVHVAGADAVDAIAWSGQVDLRTVVTAALDQTREAAAERETAVEVDLAPDPAWVTGDEDLLARGVVELLRHALRVSSVGGRVRVGVRGRGGAELQVSDTGLGLPSTEQERIWDRLDEVSGLPEDLAIEGAEPMAFVQAVMAAHGAVVDRVETPGVGSVSTWRFPTAVSTDEQEAWQDREAGDPGRRGSDIAES